MRSPYGNRVSAKKTFHSPWERTRNRVTGVFNKIRRPPRRIKWKYARSAERFCGRGEACSVCKTGVRLDNDGIHPSIHPSCRAEVGTLQRGESDEKKIFFLPSYPSASMGLYRNQEDMERISNSVSREILPPDSSRPRKIFRKSIDAPHLSTHRYLINILKHFIKYPKICNF